MPGNWEFTLKPLDENHASMCAYLHGICLVEAWKAEDFYNALCQSYVKGWGLFSQKDLKGFVLIQDKEYQGKADLLTLVIHPEEQGKGWGAFLLQIPLHQGWRSIFLEVRPSNLKAIALYQKYGFSFAGQKKDYYVTPDGNFEDALIMKWVKPEP
jgi:ribosomal-protein-alanine N-acetyltransferase